MGDRAGAAVVLSASQRSRLDYFPMRTNRQNTTVGLDNKVILPLKAKLLCIVSLHKSWRSLPTHRQIFTRMSLTELIHLINLPQIYAV